MTSCKFHFELKLIVVSVPQGRPLLFKASSAPKGMTNDCPLFQIAPWDALLRSRRGECYEVMGEFYKAVADIK